MTPAAILLLGHFEPGQLDALTQAAKSTFGPIPLAAGSVDIGAAATSQLVLAVAAEAPEDAVEIESALDSASLPRVGLLIVGRMTDSAALRALMWATMEALALRREKALLQGDLRTIARRISHDLRGPLGGVVTLAQVLQELIPPESAEPHDLLASMLRSGEKMRVIIDRVSTLTRATATPLVTSRVSAGVPFREAAARLERAAQKKGVRIEGPSDWPEVNADPALLQIVWWNLLTNAIEHPGTPGPARAGWRLEGVLGRFFVEDGGPHIPEAERGGLFSPFHLLHESRATKGLGLSIVERLVALHGGTCAYAADPSTFSFTLPIVPAA